MGEREEQKEKLPPEKSEHIHRRNKKMAESGREKAVVSELTAIPINLFSMLCCVFGMNEYMFTFACSVNAIKQKLRTR